MAEQQPSRPGGRWVWLVFASLAVLVCLSFAQSHAAQGPQSGELFPMPKSLKPNVDFWIHVFARLEGGSGVLHDDEDLSIIYETLYDLPRDRARRRSLIREKRNYYKGILKRLASGKRRGLSRDERRILEKFQGKQTAGAFLQATEQVRFQGGIREAFRAGMVRSGAYLPIIEPIFDRAGLPRELTMLPHVESSFRNDARSKSGASGIWQFIRSTGRRFMTINSHVDERHDVRLASIAATKLLKENYRLLGTWPLAITAYNHGAYGMKRAVATTGTKNIGKIVHNYRGRAFGFASRNFYAEFLAAVHVAYNYERYFGHIRFAKPAVLPSVGQREHYLVRRGDSLHRIARRFNTTVDALAALNNLEHLHKIVIGQSLRIPVPHDRYRVQRGDTLGRIARRFRTTVGTLVSMNSLTQAHLIVPGQVLRVPAGRGADALAAQNSQQPQNPRRYQVRRGDTLGRIAKRFGTTVGELVAMNNLTQAHYIKPDQMLKVPGKRTAAVPAVRKPAAPKKPLRYQVRRGDTLGHIARRHGTTVDMLVAMNALTQTRFIKPGQVLKVPSKQTAGVAVAQEPIQPQRPQHYRVKAGDSLSVIAARFDTTVATLAMLNGLSRPYLIMPGQVLDVSQAMPLRRYQVKRGDTLGRVAKRFRTTVAALAALNNLRAPYLIRAGQTLVIPRLHSRNSDDGTVTGRRLHAGGAPAGFGSAAA